MKSRAIFKYKYVGKGFFGTIHRPYVDVDFKVKGVNKFRRIRMLADTGADTTLLPLRMAYQLKINPLKECVQGKSKGIGGNEIIYYYKGRLQIRINHLNAKIPLAFIQNNTIPPLLGRTLALDLFKVCFANKELSLETR